MTKFGLFLTLFWLALVPSFAKPSGPPKGYVCTVQLPHKSGADRAHIRIDLPESPTPEVVFVMPKAIPGIYAYLNFGQYVTNFKAFTAKNAALTVTQRDTNSWTIAGAVHHIEYDIDDSWDAITAKQGAYRSAGSCFKPDTAYSLNYNSLIGFIEGRTDRAYSVKFNKPKGFVGASHLRPKKVNDTSDVVTAPNYKELIDAPILYSLPDTAFIRVGKTRISLAVYTESGQKYAATLMPLLAKQLQMQQAYLGGTLPVEKYTFLVYHSSGPEGSRLGDGLEHGNSTLCLIQSPKVEDMPGFVQEITAHEFFHILAPLNIHSDMVQNFDYLNPKFDKHLWLYEGVTEYMTMVYDVKNGETSLATLCERITAKVKEADKYDQKLSLADLSRQAMSRQDQYGNIYQKGALVGLCIDIKLRQATMGVSGLQDMMKNLLAAYGKDKSFQEKPFFDIVAKHSQPDMYYFLRDVVEDNKPMPLAHFLAEVGLKLDPKDNSVYPSEEGSATQRTLRLWWIGK